MARKINNIIMKHGNEMGTDGIPVKVWKSLGEEGVDNLFYYIVGSITEDVREQEKLPEEWRYSIIVPIFKEMGPSRVGGIIEVSR